MAVAGGGSGRSHGLHHRPLCNRGIWPRLSQSMQDPNGSTPAPAPLQHVPTYAMSHPRDTSAPPALWPHLRLCRARSATAHRHKPSTVLPSSQAAPHTAHALQRSALWPHLRLRRARHVRLGHRLPSHVLDFQPPLLQRGLKAAHLLLQLADGAILSCQGRRVMCGGRIKSSNAACGWRHPEGCRVAGC